MAASSGLNLTATYWAEIRQWRSSGGTAAVTRIWPRRGVMGISRPARRPTSAARAPAALTTTGVLISRFVGKDRPDSYPNHLDPPLTASPVKIRAPADFAARKKAKVRAYGFTWESNAE